MPITASNRIGRRLMNAHEGDEFTVRTDEGYYVSQKKVSQIQEDVVGHDRELVVGPEDGPHLLVYVDETGQSIGDLKSYRAIALGPADYGYEERGEVTELTDCEGI